LTIRLIDKHITRLGCFHTTSSKRKKDVFSFEIMGLLDLFLQSFSSISLFGALVVLLLVYILSSSSFSSRDEGKGPPGPKPLPLLGNLLQLDLKRPYHTFMEVRK